jgi:hypothetical protein
VPGKVDKKVAEVRARIAVHARWGNAEEERRARRELAGLQALRLQRKAEAVLAAAYDETEDVTP